jgi:hypothetical protein
MSQHHVLRRRLLQAGLFTTLASVLITGVCQVFPFVPDHYTFTEHEAQNAVERKFPYQRNFGQLLSADLTHPVLMLHPETNSVTIALNANFQSPLLRHPASGSFAVNSQLEYDPARYAVVLRDPKLERIDLGDLSGEDAQQLNAAASVLATQLLNHYPIYTLKPEQLSFAGVTYQPGEIRVQKHGIRVAINEKAGG